MNAEIELVDLQGSMDSDLKEGVTNWVEQTYSETQNNRHLTGIRKLVFRVDVELNHNFSQNVTQHLYNEFNKIVDNRFETEEIEIFILFSSDFVHQIFSSNGFLSDHNKTFQLDEIRQNELTSIAYESGAIYHNSGNYLYKHPSGEISDFFFRTGNIQSKLEWLRTVWFWCIPSLKDVDLIVCDTWSISSLAAFCSKLMRSYSYKKSPIDWIFLRGYIGDDAGLSEDILSIVKQDTLQVLFLMSASASGRSHKAIKSIVKSNPILKNSFTLLTLYALSDKVKSENFLCDLTESLSAKRLNGFQRIADIRPSEIVYNINTDTYIPSYQVNTEHPLVISKTDKNSHNVPAKEFFERYGGDDIFSVCRDGGSNPIHMKPRHHAFHVDVEKMFATDMFQESLSQKLDEVQKVSHVFSTDGNADLLLANLIIEKLNYEVVHCKLKSLRDLDRLEEFYENFTLADASLLVVDAQAISGTSKIMQFQIALRSIYKDHEIDPNEISSQVNYVLGLMRFDDPEDFDELISIVPQSALGSKRFLKLHIIESTILPDWHKEQCPWCNEREILIDALENCSNSMDSKSRRFVERRIRTLSNPYGLKNEVFSTRYNSDIIEFNPGSLFLDTNNLIDGKSLSESDLVFVVAATFQRWRLSTKEKPPANYVLPASITAGANTYNETMLRASIWRAITPNEFGIIKSSDEATFRALLESIYNNDELNKNGNRSGNFVLGMEAALCLGPNLEPLLGSETFEEIDWEFIKVVANRA